jgi:ubiquinone/menaquinone biosynthesis C-methylase UbiE
MRRVVLPELLDDDRGTPAEVAAGLGDLRMVNRRFGGASASTSLLRRVARARGLKQLTLLDVGGASGDVARAAQRALAEEGIELRATILDRARSHLEGSFPCVLGDALALPFSDNGFDVVHCSLFLHHLEPDAIARFAAEALRVARVAFVANDLRRHRAHLALVYAGMPLYRSRLTRHDAPVSIRRSYTEEEMKQILQPVPAGRVDITRHYLFRMGIVAWKAPC